MAAYYGYRCEFKDYSGNLITVKLFEKGGNKVTNWLPLVAKSQPLQLKTYEQEVVQGSEATFTFWVRNVTENGYFNGIQGKVFYMTIEKGAAVVFYGKLVPEFREVVYNQYPYAVTVVANDLLGYKKQQLVDTYTSDDYSLIRFIGDILQSDDITTGDKHEPSAIKVISPLWKGLQNRLMEQITIYPKRYYDLPKNEALESILRPLSMKLYQYYGEWYIIDKDFYLKSSLLTFTEYNMAGVYQGIGTLSTEQDIWDNNNDRLINSDALLGYEQPYKELVINKEYVQDNTPSLPFGNNDGLFLPPDFKADQSLFGWNLTGSVFTHQYEDSVDDGWCMLKIYKGDLTKPGGSDGTAWEESEIIATGVDYNTIQLSFDAWVTAPSANSRASFVTEREGFVFYVKYEASDGVTTSNQYWEYVSGSTSEWNDTMFKKMDIYHGSDLRYNVELEIEKPELTFTPTSEAYYLRIYRPSLAFFESQGTWWKKFSTIGVSTIGNTWMSIRNLNFKLINWDYDAIDYEQTVTVNLNPDAEIEKSVDLDWGFENKEYIHLSGAIDSDQLTDGTITQSIEYWYISKQRKQHNKALKRLSGTLKAKNVKFVSLIEDYEGNMYTPIEMTYDFESETGQFIFEELIDWSGDYNDDYNNDYLV